MTSLGKNKHGMRVYVSDEQIAQAAKNPLEWKSGLNNQQWARLRKMINKHLKKEAQKSID